MDHILHRLDPIQKQLLGAQSGPNGVYVPKDEDVPLRSWLVEQLGEEAVSLPCRSHRQWQPGFP